MLRNEIKNKILSAQRNEITEHLIYKELANSVKDKHNKNLLLHLSKDEFKHYNLLKKHTKADVKPKKFMLWKYVLISKLLGITFGIKLMERSEEHAQIAYKELAEDVATAKTILKDETGHERKIINLIDEERLTYVSSMVLGLNDALVELTGALAGLTFAFQNTRLISIAGFITGIAASLSMAASEYLAKKSEETRKSPYKASGYTGVAYIITVLFLILPYLILENPYVALAFTILIAIAVIFIFNFYVAIAKEIPFKRRFFEMLVISLGVAFVTFIIGYLIRMYFGIEI